MQTDPPLIQIEVTAKFQMLSLVGFFFRLIQIPFIVYINKYINHMN